ncbi:MAG: 30S ribosomal protein S8 [Verrucomicrobiales bacterium]
MSALTDPIADFLARFKNSTRARQESFAAPYSRLKAEIARILQEEGYIWGYDVDTSGAFPQLVVKNKYDGRAPALTDLRRISKPGRRHYVGSAELPRVIKGFGISILSTPKGVMTGARARREHVGGEYLAQVW